MKKLSIVLFCPFCCPDIGSTNVQTAALANPRATLLFSLPKYSFVLHRRDGVVVRAPASQSVDLGFIPLVESYQKTLRNGIRNFPAWRSAFREGCGEQAGKFACCVLGQGT